MVFCPNCGQTVEKKDKEISFCPYCGGSIAPPVEASPAAAPVAVATPAPVPTVSAATALAAKEQKPPKKKKGKKVLFAVIAVICALAILAGALWFALGKDGKKETETEQEQKQEETAAAFELDVSRHSLSVDDENRVVYVYAVFTEKQESAVQLVDAQAGDEIAVMLDDGSGADEKADDWIYSAEIVLDVQQESSTHLQAVCDSVKSDVEIVSVIAPLTEEELDAIDTVNDNIDYMRDSFSFTEATFEAKKTEALQLLHEMADEGLVEKETIYEDDENESITFYYTAGVMGVFDLSESVENNEFALGTSGYATVRDDQTAFAQSQTSALPHNGNQPQDVDVKLLYAWFSENDVDRYAKYRNGLRDIGTLCTNYGFNVTFDEDVTIEDLKDLSDDEFVSVNAHGTHSRFTYKNGEKFWFFFEKSSTVTTSGFELLEEATTSKNKTYSNDLKSGRMYLNGNRYIVLPAFFDEYYGRKGLQNTIISFGSCMLMGKNGEMEEDWAKVLTSKSVRAFTAYHNSVIIDYGYDMTKTMLSALQDGKTMEEALSAAKEEHGDTDTAWCLKKGYESKEDALDSTDSWPAAYAVLRGDPDARLISIIGSIRGKVADAVSKTPLSNTNISICSAGSSTEIKKVKTDSDGNFMVDLDEGTYDLVVSANGYMDCKIINVVVEKGQTTYLENTILLTKIEGNPISIVSGLVSNAVTGDGVSNATIKFRSGWGNKEGAYVKSGSSDVRIFTDDNGQFRTESLPYGYYTMEIVCEGFTTQYVNVVAVTDEDAAYNPNVTLVPEAHGSDFRITLEWEANPRDEDAHIVGEGFHVYYSNKNAYEDGNLIANLDHDDTRGNGFETITLTVDPNKTYQYYVYHYAGTGSLSTSNAIVKVYQGGVMIKQYNVPVDQGTGRYWNVFNIVDGKVISLNRISDSDEQ